MKHEYEVIVGNIGTVHTGNNRVSADCVFKRYARMSREGYGRAAGESVTLTCDGDPIKEYFGTQDTEEEE